MPTLNRRSEMPAPAEALSAWHFREGALVRLIPPWENARVIASSGPLANGSTVVIELRKGPLKIHWRAVHDRVEPGKGFRDRQEKGPFHTWMHEHRFQRKASGLSTLEDCVEYQEPFPPLGRWLGAGFIRRQLERQFQFRHARTANDLRRNAERRNPGSRTIAISGATGLVGRQLVAFLNCAGDEVRRIVRQQSAERSHDKNVTKPGAESQDIAWNQASGEFDLRYLEGCDAVVHLAGENIAGGRWTARRKAAIRSSRVDGTRQLCEALAKLNDKPKVLVAASAVGFYGSRGDERLDETSSRGEGFLAETCQEWERATKAASDAGIRVVHLRIGVVVTAQGGVLGKLLTPFKCGLGGPVGDGRQGMSWIALDDLLAAIQFAIDTPGISGPVNATAPPPLSNREFGRELARTLHRPFVFPLPAFVVRTLFGEMGSELLLGGAFVEPKKLLAHGFRFNLPTLRSALQFELGRMDPSA
ncbi:MAG: TIGR01777 family oxidoreductase [Planctomycetes bacterium]|nr:TIGR01777 family oxidoreductase [Planctomycetota bacterium]